jgi:hypothetical protein
MAARRALSFPAVPRPPNPESPPASRRAIIAVGLPAVVALAYGLGHLNWYLGTPLGRVPVLDERENLDFAAAIVNGSLPAEPFYRAPGYALVLAGIRQLGVPALGLFPAALLLGVLLHAVGAAAAALLARRWFGTGAAVLAGLLYAVDPVLVHYATQALDATLGLTLFLVGLNFLAAAWSAPGRVAPWVAASLLWGAAVIVRPNYLLPWLALPGLAAVAPGLAPRRATRAAAALSGVVLFGATALWQHQVSGVAGFLPWQGAYNLWAANRPGANGRYYVQHVSLAPELARANPARAESVLLYDEEVPQGPGGIPAMNAHWRARFLGQVSSHPLSWAKLMARKTYALLNTWEQYNNKTFAFHKARSPWLAWNPICWGLLLVLGVAGAARLAAESPRAAGMLAAVAAATAASIVLFFVSARFRLPLAALLAVLAGGALDAPRFWRAWPARGQAGLAAGLALAAFVAFSHFDHVDDRATYAQDHVLLARAAFTVGDDELAIREAEETLKLQPWHPDAHAILAAARADLAARAARP